MKMLAPTADAQKAMHIAVGAASPLWFLYAGAGAAGAGLFWLNRWREAANVEALFGVLREEADAGADPIVEALPEPVAEPEPEPDPDDLTVLVGIGPKLSASLAERGITRYAHIAALTPKRIARLDQDMRLMGRIERDAWVAQAKRLAEA